jgi:hypothetical protein
VAELVPVERAKNFVPFHEVVRDMRGLMLYDDQLDEQLHELDEPPRDPFA